MADRARTVRAGVQSAPIVDLNELLVFTRVVQTGSFTAAARLLDMPKSSVSKKVADLENRVGARLLQRTTRKLGLTDAGRVYFDRAARIVAEAEDADRAVSQLQAAPRGLLRITVPLSFELLGPVVTAFLGRYPDVQIDMVCTDRKVDLVDEGFDVAIRAGPLEDSALVARSLGTIRRVLVASPGYLRKRGSPTTPGQLAKHDCIAFGGGSGSREWALRRGDAVEHVRVSPRFVVNDFDLMRDAARMNVGIAFALDSVVDEDLRAGELRRVLAEWSSPDTPVHVLYPSTRHLSPKVVAFVDTVRADLRLATRAKP